ncbi:hypothetical protein Mth01_52220 [Sphaerimonospora thailandensis]|uniref:Secreted protein n=1 Tax=Sphaerimonospora thailandensis TaxID=795644 RepID=A0A8J3RFU3_9ACTN|nr:hypothetical protein Mth01_52220 [Sphaerimonospora thailandensis]
MGSWARAAAVSAAMVGAAEAAVTAVSEVVVMVTAASTATTPDLFLGFTLGDSSAWGVKSPKERTGPQADTKSAYGIPSNFL